jgi:hypothetical protein
VLVEFVTVEPHHDYLQLLLPWLPSNKAVANFMNSPPERNLVYRLYDCQKVRVQFRESSLQKNQPIIKAQL